MRITLLLLLLAIPQTILAQEKIRIRAILPLTGPTADYGISIQNAIQLALEDTPQANDVLDISYDDALYDTKLAVSSFHRARNEGVDIIYTWGVTFCEALAPLAEQFQIPVIGQCVDYNASRGRKYFMRFMNSSTDYMDSLLETLIHQGYRSASILLAENPYFEQIYRELQKVAQQKDFSLTLFATLPQGEMEYLRSLLPRLKQQNPKTVGVFLFTGQTAKFFQLARDYQFRPFMFGSNVFDSASEIRSAQGAMEGALYTSIAVHPEFEARFLKRFPNISQLGFGIPAYELISFLTTRLRDKEKRELLKQLRAPGEFTGRAAGSYQLVDTPEAGVHAKFRIAPRRIHGDRGIQEDNLRPTASIAPPSH